MLFGPIHHITWHAHIRREDSGIDGGGGGGVSWQSQHVMSGGTAMLSMIIEYSNLPVMIACIA
jgi:hypothetical protein